MFNAHSERFIHILQKFSIYITLTQQNLEEKINFLFSLQLNEDYVGFAFGMNVMIAYPRAH